MSEQIEFFIAIQIISIFLLILIERSVLKKWKKNRNNLEIFVFFFTIVILMGTIIRLFNLIGLSIDFTIGGGLTLYFILVLITITFPLDFILYLKQLKRFYLLPMISSLYIGLAIYLYNLISIFILYAIICVIINLDLAYKGWKNRNGMVFMISIYVIINGLFPNKGSLFVSIITFFSIILLYCGSTSGFIDKYFFVDKEEKQRLQNIWISKILIEEKA